MHTSELLVTLGGALSVALVFGYLTQRLGLSPIVGYLIGGVVIGPNTPGFTADRQIAEQLAELGVILLMFGVGLHFHLQDLMAVRRVVVPGAILQIVASTVMGTLVGLMFGWSGTASLVYGLCVSVASTVVMTRVLGERNQLHTPLGHTAIGWLVVQDIFAVFVLVLMPALLGGHGTEAPDLLRLIAWIGLKVVVVAVVILVGGGTIVPLLLRHVAATHSRELFTLTILVVAIGISVTAYELFGLSMALGAFLAGMVVGGSEFSLRAAIDALPMRDAFAVLFFVSVGMLFDPALLLAQPALVAGTLVVVMVGTPLATCLLLLALRRPTRSAVGMGLALGQIGEFTFLVATVGSRLRALPEEALQALVAVAIVSISLNPLVYRLVGPIEAWLSRRRILVCRLAARERLERVQTAVEVQPRYRAVVVGYGPVGRTLVRLLRENGIEPTVIEMSLERYRQVRADRLPAVYGDAAHCETLRAAGVEQCDSLFLTSSSLSAAGEVVRLARELNPNVRVVARSSYLRERSALLKAGADAVFSGEGEIALAMSESLLKDLGASPEQVDRERERVRAELFGETARRPARPANDRVTAP
jgi:CPA2 family monovalent cation:H+ antiporter-2